MACATDGKRRKLYLHELHIGIPTPSWSTVRVPINFHFAAAESDLKQGLMLARFPCLWGSKVGAMAYNVANGTRGKYVTST